MQSSDFRDCGSRAPPSLREPDLLCPECGYNVAHLTQDRCPECGNTFDTAMARRREEEIAGGISSLGAIAYALILPGVVAACWVMIFLCLRSNGGMMPASGFLCFAYAVVLIGMPISAALIALRCRRVRRATVERRKFVVAAVFFALLIGQAALAYGISWVSGGVIYAAGGQLPFDK